MIKRSWTAPQCVFHLHRRYSGALLCYFCGPDHSLQSFPCCLLSEKLRLSQPSRLDLLCLTPTSSLSLYHHIFFFLPEATRIYQAALTGLWFGTSLLPSPCVSHSLHFPLNCKQPTAILSDTPTEGFYFLYFTRKFWSASRTGRLHPTCGRLWGFLSHSSWGK